MIDTPEIVQTTAQQTAVIHLTIPRDQIQTVMGPAIEEVSATRTTAEWLDLLAEHDIPAMKYNRMADVLTDPHLADVGFFEELESPKIGTYRSMKHPVHYAGTPVSNYAHPPMLDADGDEIRAALGM